MFEKARSHMCSLAKQRKEKKKNRQKQVFLESLVKYEDQIPDSFDFCVICAGQHFTEGFTADTWDWTYVVNPVDFISNRRGQRSGYFSQGCTRCSNSFKQSKAQRGLTSRLDYLPTADSYTTCTQHKPEQGDLIYELLYAFLYMNLKVILLVCRDSTRSWWSHDHQATSTLSHPAAILTTRKKKTHGMRYLVCIRRFSRLKYCARNTGCVIVAAHGCFKWCSRYQLVRARSVYIFEISEAKKVSTHDMRSSTAGICRSTCRDDLVHFAFHIRY